MNRLLWSVVMIQFGALVAKGIAYEEGYQWNWTNDFVIASSGYANPESDSEGTPGVWRYTYNTNGADSATIRNTGREDLPHVIHGSLNGIWSTGNTASWSAHSSAFVRGSTEAGGFFHIAGATYVDGKAQLAQLVWTAPIDATIRVHGVVKESQAPLGDGFSWYIDAKIGGLYTQLDSGTLNDTTVGLSSQAVDTTINVEAGDEIVFSVDANGGAYNDRAEYYVVYEIVPYVNPYEVGYQWNWKEDFVIGAEAANPEKDGVGTPSVWSYMWNPNGSENAQERGTGREYLSDALHNGVNGIWASLPESWSSKDSAAIRGNTNLSPEVWHIIPAESLGDVFEGTETSRVVNLVWTSPVDGLIRVHGSVEENQPAAALGWTWFIDAKTNGVHTQLDTGTLNNTAEANFDAVDLTIAVEEGDEIVFSVDANGGQTGDRSEYNVVYELLPDVRNYEGWAGSWGVEIGASTNDFDGDGMNNLAEYGMGGVPTNAANIGHSPVISSSAESNGVSVSYVYKARHPTSIDYYLELTDNLTIPSWTNEGYAVVGYGALVEGFRDVTNAIPSEVDARYIRLKIHNP